MYGKESYRCNCEVEAPDGTKTTNAILAGRSGPRRTFTAIAPQASMK